MLAGRFDEGDRPGGVSERDDGHAQDHDRDMHCEEVGRLETARVLRGDRREEDCACHAGCCGAEGRKMLAEDRQPDFGLLVMQILPGPGGKGRVLGSGGAQFRNAGEELLDVPCQPARGFEIAALRFDLGQAEGARDPDHGRREQEGDPAEPDIVVEEQPKRRNQEQRGQHAVGRDAGDMIPYILEHHGSRREFAGAVAAKESRGKAQQAVPDRGPDPGGKAPFGAHERCSAKNVHQGGSRGQPGQNGCELEEHRRIAARRHGADQQADGKCRRQRQGAAGKAGQHELDQIQRRPGAPRKQQVFQACRVLAAQSGIQQVDIPDFVRGLAVRPAGPAGRRIHDPVSAGRTGQQCHRLPASPAKSQHGAAVSEPPAAFLRQPHPARANRRCFTIVPQRRLPVARDSRRAYVNAFPPADHAQGLAERGFIVLGAKARVVKRLEAGPGPGLFVLTPCRLGDLQIGFVDQRQATVEALHIEKPLVKPGQDLAQQAAAVEAGGQPAFELCRRVQADP